MFTSLPPPTIPIPNHFNYLGGIKECVLKSVALNICEVLNIIVCYAWWNFWVIIQTEPNFGCLIVVL